MTYSISEIFTMLKDYRSGVVITEKINSPTMCLDFDQSANPDSAWYSKGRFHNCSSYISSIRKLIRNPPTDTPNDSVQNLKDSPKTTVLHHTPSTQYFLKENCLIMIFHKNRVTSYPYMERAAKKLGTSLAPVLFKGKLESVEHLESIINNYKSSHKSISHSSIESPESSANLVIRALSSFLLEEYSNNIFEF